MRKHIQLYNFLITFKIKNKIKIMEKTSTVSAYFGRKLDPITHKIINNAAIALGIPFKRTAPTKNYPKGLHEYPDSFLALMKAGTEKIG
jgi:hypothetical protein